MASTWKTIIFAVSLAGCVSYRPAPLSVSVTSIPAGARAKLSCPNMDVQEGDTPSVFRVPRYATPCALVLSRDGFRSKQFALTLDLLQANSCASRREAPPRKPIRFKEGATPFSLLGALIVRSLDNFAASVGESVGVAVMPDARINVILEADEFEFPR